MAHQDLILSMSEAVNSIDFASFMAKALYDPIHGYYAHSHKQGIDGDYITSPSHSPLFSKILAHHFLPFFSSSPAYDYAEFGPGDGLFTMDFLNHLYAQKSLPKSSYMIDTMSKKRSYLQRKCQTQPQPFLNKIRVVESLPDHFSGMIFFNEVLDALPTHLCYSDDDQMLHQIHVSNDKPHRFITHPIDQALLDLFETRSIPRYPRYYYEISTQIPVFIQALSDKVKKGLLVFFDYGYNRTSFYHPLRKKGTLQAFYQHTVVQNPLAYPGKTDLSVHVDFTLLYQSLINCGFNIDLYSTQGRFLTHPIHHKILQQLHQKDALSSFKTLFHPGEMGDQIKIMIASKNISFDHSVSDIDMRYQL